jgi:cell division septal protein FtsQ
MKKNQPYHRTAALLGAQQRPYAQRARTVRVSWKVIAPLVVVLGVLLWLWVDNRWYLLGNDLTVAGASSETTVWDVTVASDLLGWHSFRLRPERAAARIVEKVPAVLEAEVTCTRYPVSCAVRVVEREPALAWATDSATYWIDREGVCFPGESARADLPLVQGPLPQEQDNSQVWLSILESVDALLALGIGREALTYHPQRGLVWVDPAGRHVAFGTGADMALRWRVYQVLIEHLEAEGIGVWGIDVRFPQAPTYAPERAW